MARAPAAGKLESKALEVFKQFDLNGDGAITREELAAVFRKLDPEHWSDSRVAALIEAADSDRSGNIQYAEFVYWLNGGLGGAEWDVDREAVQLKGDSKFSTAVLRFDNRQTTVGKSQFTVTIRIENGEKLGIKVEKLGGGSVFVSNVKPDGLLADWNTKASIDNSGVKVSPGDRILEVNGCVDEKKMFAELKRARSVDIVVEAQEPGVCFLSRIADSYSVSRSPLVEGKYSSVHRATHKVSRETYAVKTVHKQYTQRSVFEATVESIKQMDHPHIIRLYEVFEDYRSYHLVLELCRGGEVFERVLEEEQFSEHQASRLMEQILQAISYMHSRSVCHRAIKLESFLLQSDAPLEACNIKLIDFRFARSFHEGSIFQTLVGDAIYRSPSVLERRYNHKCDVWACGVVLYFAIAGYPPFGGVDDLEVHHSIQNDPLIFPDEEWRGVSQEGAKDLIGGLLHKDAGKRLSLDDARRHPWIEQTSSSKRSMTLTVGQQNMRSYRGHSTLKKAALHTMAQRISDDDVAQLRRMFALLDKNGDGTVTFYELQEGLSQLGQPATAKHFAELMEAADVDGSKRLEYTEFLAATLDKRHYRKHEACWAAFHVFDRDGSGTIDKSELAAVLANGDLRDAVGEDAVAKVLQDCDKDQDGTIDFEEFLKMMQEDEI